MAVDEGRDLCICQSNLVGNGIGGIVIEAALGVEVGGAQSGKKGGVRAVSITFGVVAVGGDGLRWRCKYRCAISITAAVEITEGRGQIARAES